MSAEEFPGTSVSAANNLAEQDAPGLGAQVRLWLLTESPWWLVSSTIHMVLFLVLAFVRLSPSPAALDAGVAFESSTAEIIEPTPELLPLDLGQASETPGELTTESLLSLAENPADLAGIGAEDDASGDESGRGVPTLNPARGAELGFTTQFVPATFGAGPTGRGGSKLGDVRGGPLGGHGQSGFDHRDPNRRRGVAGGIGNTKAAERSVVAALRWLARHQLPDGRWSLTQYAAVCADSTCTGPGKVEADTAATALALLPFLAAGQTHQSRGPYKPTIARGLEWLFRHQKPDGDLRGTGNMYAHGLAAIALCEAYGLTGDRSLGYAAQAALDFLQRVQNAQTGGWRYQPGEDGDTSVVGWQLMALKSGLMAGLKVDPASLEGVKRWLRSVDSDYGGTFAYRPDGPPSPTMSAVGLLCTQYLGARRDDPGLVEGARYLMSQTPEQSGRNLYYWYYATQVLHNLPGTDWDTWNRQTRRVLIETQNKDPQGCAQGSWDPVQPAPDPWGQHGGRLMMTSLAALTLEVYYRYLPLYKLDQERELRSIAE